MLGGEGEVLGDGKGRGGHISRNIRLCLISADAVRPYVRVDAVTREGVGRIKVTQSEPKLIIFDSVFLAKLLATVGVRSVRVNN